MHNGYPIPPKEKEPILIIRYFGADSYDKMFSFLYIVICVILLQYMKVDKVGQNKGSSYFVVIFLAGKFIVARTISFPSLTELIGFFVDSDFASLNFVTKDKNCKL